MMRPAGFSYTEALVATALIAILLLPALESMLSGVQGSGINLQLAQNQYQILAKLEQTLARPYSDLLAQADSVADPNQPIPAPYSDAAGSEFRRLVFLSRYDGDNADGDDDPFTGTDRGLIWVRVSLENSPISLESLVHE